MTKNMKNANFIFDCLFALVFARSLAIAVSLKIFYVDFYLYKYTRNPQISPNIYISHFLGGKYE